MKAFFARTRRRVAAVAVAYLFVLGASDSASAQEHNWFSLWDAGGSDRLWSTAENWEDDQIPPSGNRGVEIMAPAAGAPNGPIINSDVGSIQAFYLGRTAHRHTPTCTMTDGSLTVTGTPLLGHQEGASAILIIRGGVMTFEKKINNTFGAATIKISGSGKLNCLSGISLGTNGRGASRIQMTGGFLNTASLVLPVGPGTRKAFVDLHGGTIYVSSALKMGPDSHIDIRNDGALKLTGDARDTIRPYVTAGWITGYDSSSQVRMVFDGTHTMVSATKPLLAYNGLPEYGATGVDPDVSLSWTPGSEAASHDVYFGTIASPGAAEFRGNQLETRYDPMAGPLSHATTYYWRIDQRNSAGQLEWGPGRVRMFTTRSPRPSIIVTEDEFDGLRSRASRSPWREMKTAAISDAETLAYSASLTPYGKGKCMRLRDIVSSNALAYILDPANRTTYKNKIRDQLNMGLDDLMATFPGSWDSVPLGCLLFNATLALDIVFDDLTPDERRTLEKKIESLVRMIKEWWFPAPQAVRGIWALYQGDTVAFESNRTRYTSQIDAFFTDDGVFTSGNGYAAARLGFHERQQKSLFLDVLEYHGYHDFYSNDKIRKGHEYLYGYSVTPFGRCVPFGDTSPNDRLWHYTTSHYPDNASTQIYRAGRFGEKAGRYAAWQLKNNVPWGRLLAYILTEQEPSSTPELAPSRIFSDGGAFFVERAQSTRALFCGLWNPTFHEDNHAHKEVNAIAMAAYGEHVLRNAGYQGWRSASHGFSWDYINQSAHSGNTVTIQGEDHVSKDGAGIAEGFTGLGVDYASGDSGSALPNGCHQRNLVFVQPQDGAHGYWILFDEVRAHDSGQHVRLNLHPNSDVMYESSAEQEYRSSIGPHTYSGHEVLLTIFLGTKPIRIQQQDGLLASWNGESFLGKVLIPVYQTGAQGRCAVVTILFPHDAAHAKARFERLFSENATGASITQGSVVDVALESSGAGVATHGNIAFQGLGCWYRANLGSSAAYFVRKGTSFDNGSEDRIGFESSRAVSIYFEGPSARIISPGTEITLYCPSIIGVKRKQVGEDSPAQDMPIVAAAAGWVRVMVPVGVHEIEAILDELH